MLCSSQLVYVILGPPTSLTVCDTACVGESYTKLKPEKRLEVKYIDN